MAEAQKRLYEKTMDIALEIFSLRENLEKMEFDLDKDTKKSMVEALERAEGDMWLAYSILKAKLD